MLRGGLHPPSSGGMRAEHAESRVDAQRGQPSAHWAGGSLAGCDVAHAVGVGHGVQLVHGIGAGGLASVGGYLPCVAVVPNAGRFFGGAIRRDPRPCWAQGQRAEAAVGGGS